MHFSDCVFLLPYKEHLLHCGIANQFLKYEDLSCEWACGGCLIPSIISANCCLYLAPKRFLDRNGSLTQWSCALTGEELDSPAVCNQCECYRGLRLGSRLDKCSI